MKTKLEDIKTAAELLTYTTAFGVPTDSESICRMQDIIGHATLEELESLANDYNESGTCRTGKQFYFLLFHIWSWEDATRFFMQHSSVTVKNLEDTIENLSQDKLNLTRELEHLKASDEMNREALRTANERCKELDQENKEQGDKIISKNNEIFCLKQEITELKAKLYDLMTK